MSTRRVLIPVLIVAAVAALGPTSFSRSLPMSEEQIRQQGQVSTAVTKKHCIASHNVGRVSLAVTNYGTYGNGFAQGTALDCFTGINVPSCEYPKGSGTYYLFAGGFWIGAVVNHDTMVTQGIDGWQNCREMDTQISPFGDMQRKSIIDPSKPEYIGAKSEQDLIGVYTDSFKTGVVGLCTGVNDPVNGLGHRPLYIEVEERSYAWSYSYAQDFVLFDYTIKNIGTYNLTNMYIGIYNDADVGPIAQDQTLRAADDVTGFRQDVPTPPAFTGLGRCEGWKDTVNLAWIADNDGNWDLSPLPPTPAVGSMRIVRTPIDSMDVSYNWWVSNGTVSLDYGPQKVATYRDLGTGGRGTPEGDRNKYAFLKNREFDYDQVFTCDSSNAAAWEPLVNQNLCQSISKGYDTRYLLSFGPFNLPPGQFLPLSFAYVMGAGFHRSDKKDNGKYLTDPALFNPKLWYSNLDFTNLALNAVWAGWIYDNPGYSAKGGANDFKGNFRVCNLSSPPDTIYYTGDGEPDFRGAAPPPAPDIWVYPEDKQLRVRWNGLRSETTKGIFSKVRDFEGYRVYLSLDERAASFSMIESFDLLDYNKFVYNPGKPGGAGFELRDNPYPYAYIDSVYGNSDPAWDPLHFTALNPFHPAGSPDSTFYFTAQDYNRSRYGIDTRITKIYPDAPQPTILNADSIPTDQRSTYLTEDGHFKYYEYQLIITNLLPTIPYYVNVTSFSFGSPASGLGSLETSPTVGYRTAYAAASYEQGTTSSKEVYVFPNPYRTDGGYQANGYEGNDPMSRGKPIDRQRRVHFANVPSNCTIRVYTLDGDLVKEIAHPDVLSPCQEDPNVACWDLITRNTQLAVSGIYYWTVDDHKGNVQIGKLVLIM